MSSTPVNIVKNSFVPFSSFKLVQGSAEYIAIEVFVSWMIRRVMGLPRGLITLSTIHAVSLPFLGGAIGFADASAGYDEDFPAQFQAGAKGVPAVWLAHYIVQVFEKGFTLPAGGIKEYLVTAISKILSRPLASSVVGYLPDNVTDALQVLHALVIQQTKASNFSS